MVRGVSLARFFFCFFFFFFFFLNHVFIVKVQELACIMRYGVKKTQILTTARFTFHGKNPTPRIHRKNPPRLAPKTIKPQRRKETIHRDIQERDPNPTAGSPKTKERMGSRRPDRAEGGGRVITVTRENHWTCGPTL